MRTVVKANEPGCVTQARSSSIADFDDAVDASCKQRIREALVVEQRGLCCYCGGRIRATADEMKVEHLVPRSHPERGHEERLAWNNLFGACRGGEGSPPAQQHCDTRKGNHESPLSPLDASLRERVKYSSGGYVESNEPGLAEALDEVLGLNVAKLVNNRREVIARLREAANRWAGKNDSAWFSRQLRTFASSSTAVLPEYAQVGEYWLRKHAKAP